MRFNLQNHLDRFYESSERTIPRKEPFAVWQSSFRDELAKILGIAGGIPTDIPKTELLSSQDKSTYIEEKHALLVDDVSVPMYLLIPKSAPPYKPIMVFHGHARTVHYILGNYPDEATQAERIANDGNYAQRFAQDGYLVCAIEQQGFGERVTHQVSDNQFQNSCRHLTFEYMMQGKSILGERVREGMAAINYLLSRDDIVADQLACTGHSTGGTTTLFLSALDTRITSSVVSGYFCDYKHSILGMQHCECNYIPNLLTSGDIGDVAALIAPRPLRFINGRNDPIFPIAGIDKPYQTVQQAYNLSDVPDACSLVLHDGGHRYDYAIASEWLESWL